MIGAMVALPEDERTPEQRTDKLFRYLNKDRDRDTINKDDFKKLLKFDAAIVNALNSYEGLV